tara:strand:+ start:551 stop:1696 length:1146 start_codon:yes stop_codon:yes gene_type:complete
MIKKQNDTYYANELELKSLRAVLGLEKDKMGAFFKNNGIKKIGNRTYVKIENCEEKFEVNKFSEIAFAFNSEFRKKNLPNKTAAFRLYKNDKLDKKKDKSKSIKTSIAKQINFSKNNKKLFSAKLDRIFNAENLHRLLKSHYHRKKVFNLGSIFPEAIEDVEKLFDQITIFDDKISYARNSDDLTDFSLEKKKLQHSAEINSILQRLENNYNVRLYMGILVVPVARAFPVKETGVLNDIEEFEFGASEDEYLFYYFAPNNPEYIIAKYEAFQSEDELTKILKKYSVKAKIETKKSDSECFRVLNGMLSKLSKGKHYLFETIHEDSIAFDLQTGLKDSKDDMSFLDDEDLSAGTKLNSEEEYTDEDYADMYAEQQLNEMRGK